MRGAPNLKVPRPRASAYTRSDASTSPPSARALIRAAITTVLPNIYYSEQLREFAAAPATADLTTAELDQVADLYENGFYLEAAATGA